MALTVPLLVMYEVELISFVDHDAADTYASFTKVSAPLKLGGLRTSLLWCASHGNRRRDSWHQYIS